MASGRSGDAMLQAQGVADVASAAGELPALQRAARALSTLRDAIVGCVRAQSGEAAAAAFAEGAAVDARRDGDQDQEQDQDRFVDSEAGGPRTVADINQQTGRALAPPPETSQERVVDALDVLEQLVDRRQKEVRENSLALVAAVDAARRESLEAARALATEWVSTKISVESGTPEECLGSAEGWVKRLEGAQGQLESLQRAHAILASGGASGATSSNGARARDASPGA